MATTTDSTEALAPAGCPPAAPGRVRVPLTELHEYLVATNQRITGSEWLPITGGVLSGNERVGYTQQAQLRVHFAPDRAGGAPVDEAPLGAQIVPFPAAKLASRNAGAGQRGLFEEGYSHE